MNRTNPRVLMIGWEWPPFNSGGLGVACYGLTKALAQQGVGVTFVLPKKIPAHADFLNFVFCEENDERRQPISVYGANNFSGHSLAQEIEGMLKAMQKIVREQKFDVIHAHDWMTFDAGLMAKALSGKPLVTHVHSTEFDRTGGHNINQFIYHAEKRGVEGADRVVPVSNFTKEKVIAHYNISSRKIVPIHNGLEYADFPDHDLSDLRHLEEKNKIVLFVGRITIQKGPDYFVKAARKVLNVDPNVIFIVSGSGDMESRMVQEVAHLGMGQKFIFTGFLRGEELNKIYQLADLYVMPSISEPFGLTALESMANGTPVLLSKQTGVAEVVKHALRVDFWDVDEMANQILAALRYNSLKECLKQCGLEEVKKITWDVAAKKCLSLYKSLCQA